MRRTNLRPARNVPASATTLTSTVLTDLSRVSANSHLPKPKAHGKLPLRPALLREDSSIDELASGPLTDTSEDLTRASSRSYASPATRSPSSSSTILSKFLSKPPQSSPPDSVQPERNSPRPAKAALAQKTTNMKAISRNRKALKQSISSPIQHMLNLGGDDQLQTIRRSDDAVTTLSTATGAADLSKKISDLMTAANPGASEGPIRDRDDNLSRAESRTHRLQRGRKAIAKAGKAIVERFSNSLERNTRKGLQDSDTSSISSNRLLAPDPDTASDTANNRMSRRIAEGTNLNNPKIRSLTGDGNVPRKPLPVYERMKRISQKDKSLEHRFSDSHRSCHGSFGQGSSALDVDIGSRKSRPTSMQEPLLMQGHREDLYQSTTDLSPPDAEQPSMFSEAISGLAQHPDVSFFSSSPDGRSTPRLRLEPTYTPEGKKRLTMVPSDAIPLLDLAIKNENIASSGDELASPVRNKVSKSLSLKRKTAKEHLRSAGTRPSKKSKKASGVSKEEILLAFGIEKSDTQDTSALKSKDTNKKVSVVKQEGSTAKGLSIFDTVTTKESETLPVTGAKKLRRRPSKRSSIPKPIRKISARDRRASSFLTASSKDMDESSKKGRNGTDVDDLQLDLSEYNLGTKKR